MARPTEYDNLVKIGQLKDAGSSPDSIAQFMQMAQDMLEDSRARGQVGARGVER